MKTINSELNPAGPDAATKAADMALDTTAASAKESPAPRVDKSHSAHTASSSVPGQEAAHGGRKTAPAASSHKGTPTVSRSGSAASGSSSGHRLPEWAEYLVSLLNALVLLGSVLIIVGLSIEVFHDSDQMYYRLYMRLQLWVCIVFLLDFFVRFFLSRHKWRFLARNFIFFLVAIPYLQIFTAIELPLSAEAGYLLRLMPLIRGGYGLALMVGWITRNRTTSLMVSYVLMILALIYFASLVFYSLEHAINPMVTSFGASLSWAFMNVTTVGSNIYAMTATGKVLAIVLAASGMMMFPIFTVYITGRFQTYWRGKNPAKSDPQDGVQ